MPLGFNQQYNNILMDGQLKKIFINDLNAQ